VLINDLKFLRDFFENFKAKGDIILHFGVNKILFFHQKKKPKKHFFALNHTVGVLYCGQNFGKFFYKMSKSYLLAGLNVPQDKILAIHLVKV
jgi:hypothetical protein